MSVTNLSTTTRSACDTIDDDGVWIGKRTRGGKYVRYPDGEIRRVDRDFDCTVFDDPDSVPTCEVTAEALRNDMSMAVADVTPSPEGVQRLADALLALSPKGLIAIYHDRTGQVLGATVTPLGKARDAPVGRGLTAAVFRAALRGLPTRAQQVTFAANGDVAAEVRDAATEAAEICLVQVIDFIRHSH